MKSIDLNFFDSHCNIFVHRMKEIITIKADQMRKLTKMNRSSEFDTKFVGMLLSIVFGDDILKSSCHKSLDQQKLKFIKGMK